MLTATLFAGPLLQMLLAVAADQEGTSALQTLRNLIVAPVTEEFCFRACMSPLLLLQARSGLRDVMCRLYSNAVHLDLISIASVTVLHASLTCTDIALMSVVLHVLLTGTGSASETLVHVSLTGIDIGRAGHL